MCDIECKRLSVAVHTNLSFYYRFFVYELLHIFLHGAVVNVTLMGDRDLVHIECM